MASQTLVVAGTDTGVGKTVLSAMLTLAADGVYWKPVQSGTRGGTDSRTVRAITGLGPERILPEGYAFKAALSPHRAAELEGTRIDPARLARLPEVGRTLIVELAGGLLVPWTRTRLQLDAVARWRAPVILCARTTLGTINHTLLSIEALRRRQVPLLGVAFIGAPQEDSERLACRLGRTRRLGRLPWLTRLDPESLRRAFRRNFAGRLLPR